MLELTLFHCYFLARTRRKINKITIHVVWNRKKVIPIFIYSIYLNIIKSYLSVKNTEQKIHSYSSIYYLTDESYQR